MKKYPSNIAAILSRPRSFLFATAALAALCAPAALAAPAQQPPAGENYCQMVKNANARALCATSREQFYARNYRSALVTVKKALLASPEEGILRAIAARIILAGLGDTAATEAELRRAYKQGAPYQTVLPMLLPLMVERHEEQSLLTEFAEPAPGAKGDEAGEILHGRALALSSLDRLDEAASVMDRALSLQHNVRNLVGRAEIAYRQNDPALAGKMTDAAYHLDPKNRIAVLAKLKQIQRTGDAAQTIAFARKTIEQNPGLLEPRRALIETYMKLNQDAKAKAEVDSILAKAPRSNVGAIYKALLMARANQKDEAWQIIFAVPPAFLKQNPDLALPMAQVAFDTGHQEVGGKLLGNAIAAAPDLLDARLRLVELRLSQRSPQSALTLLSPVKSSQDPRVKRLIGQAQAQITKDRGF